MSLHILTDDDQALLTVYATAHAHPVVGYGIPTPHFQALSAVATLVEKRTRERVVAELGGADVHALVRVAEAAAALLLFCDTASRDGKRALRKDADVIGAELHERLDAAGFTARSEVTGHHERPGQPRPIGELIDASLRESPLADRSARGGDPSVVGEQS